MMFEGVAILKKYGEATFDAYGNETNEVTTRKVFVKPRGVYNSEFYNAAQLGLHPSITFDLSMREEYDGEKIIEFEGKDYDVIRVDWDGRRDSISLVCEERVKNG